MGHRKNRWHTNDRSKNKKKYAALSREQRLKIRQKARERQRQMLENETLLHREIRLAKARWRQKKNPRFNEKRRKEKKLQSAMVELEKQEEMENVERWMQEGLTYETKVWRKIGEQLYERPQKVTILSVTPIKHTDIYPHHTAETCFTEDRNSSPDSEYMELSLTEDRLNNEIPTNFGHFLSPVISISREEVVVKTEPEIYESDEQEMILTDVHIPCIEPEIKVSDVQFPSVNKPMTSMLSVQHNPFTSVIKEPESEVIKPLHDSLIQAMTDKFETSESELTKGLGASSQQSSETNTVADFPEIKCEINIKTEEEADNQ